LTKLIALRGGKVDSKKVFEYQNLFIKKTLCVIDTTSSSSLMVESEFYAQFGKLKII
jgi:hypothetical protein